jgi:hypothetical protein
MYAIGLVVYDLMLFSNEKQLAFADKNCLAPAFEKKMEADLSCRDWLLQLHSAQPKIKCSRQECYTFH